VVCLILGIGFNKISAEKKKMAADKLQVNNNVEIRNIEKAEIGGAKKETEGIKVTFAFKTSYSPSIGEILLEGELVAVEDKKVAEEALKEWKKNKTLSKELLREVMDSILARATIEAVVISREISLPPPIPFPKVSDRQDKPVQPNQPYIG